VPGIVAVRRACLALGACGRREFRAAVLLFLARGIEFGSGIDHQVLALCENGSPQGTRSIAHFALHRRILTDAALP
jgi:hypothetical protein